MKVKGTNGKTYTLTLAKYVGSENTNPSTLHIKVRQFLEENFPALTILEEVYIESEKLYLDFYISTLKIACEAMGAQHDKDNRFFFKTKMDFYRAKARDRCKAEWCELNGITLVYFYPDEDEEQWRQKLNLPKKTSPSQTS